MGIPAALMAPLTTRKLLMCTEMHTSNRSFHTQRSMSWSRSQVRLRSRRDRVNGSCRSSQPASP